MRSRVKLYSLVFVQLLCVAALLVFAGRPSCAGDGDRVIPDVVYGHKDGMALTFDVIKPVKSNGAGIIRIQSAGWYSQWSDPKGWLTADLPFLSKGYTMFVVRHGSAPKYTIPEITDDVRRSIRAIRLNAHEYGVDPERLGVLGASAGGHLALMVATTGDDGDPKSSDEVLRQSSRVAVVVALYPPTDLREWVRNPPSPTSNLAFVRAPLSFDPAKAKDYSPALLVTDKTTPTLLLHGDKDPLVPLEQSRIMFAALQEHKIPSKFMVIEGGGHGFEGMQLFKAYAATMNWFDSYLAKQAK